MKISHSQTARTTQKPPAVAPKRKAQARPAGRAQPARRPGYSGRSSFEQPTSRSSRTQRTAPVSSRMSTETAAQVRMMAAQARRAGVPAELPVMTSLVETGFRNLNYGDRDSVGMFQQRNAWGSRADRMNPERSTQMFLQGGSQGQRGAADFARRFSGQPQNAQTLGRWAQAVQVSAFPNRYAAQYDRARAMLRQAGVPGY